MADLMRRYINVHLQHTDYRETLRVSKGDVLTLAATLYGWDDQATDQTWLSNLSTSNIILHGARADGSAFEYTASGVNGNVITFDIDENMTGFSGKGNAEIIIVPSWLTDKALFSANFIVDVEPDPEEIDTRGGRVKEITRNGRVDMTGFRYAFVNVPGGGGNISDLLEGSKAAGSVVLDISETHLVELMPHAFYRNTTLKEITVDAGVIGEGAFRYGFGLEKVTLKGCTYLNTRAFDSCSSLAELHFTDITAVPGMADETVLAGSEIAYGTGAIYFPTQALADAAKTATNWTRFASVIQAEP